MVYTEHIVCRAEPRLYPLSIDIKASVFNYWQRLKYSTNNVLLRKAIQYSTKHTSLFNMQKKEEISKTCKVNEHIKNALLVIKKTLRNHYLQNGL